MTREEVAGRRARASAMTKEEGRRKLGSFFSFSSPTFTPLLPLVVVVVQLSASSGAIEMSKKVVGGWGVGGGWGSPTRILGLCSCKSPERLHCCVSAARTPDLPLSARRLYLHRGSFLKCLFFWTSPFSFLKISSFWVGWHLSQSRVSAVFVFAPTAVK